MFLLKKLIVSILTCESRMIRRKYKPFIIAVTGSVGKTSTKDAIYDVLTAPGTCRADGTGICHVRKSEKSMNSEIGLPLTVIGVPNAWYSIVGWVNNILEGLRLIFSPKSKAEYPDCLVLEIGADHPGDIRSVAKWLRPDIAVITKISRTPVHVEFFASPEEVFEEKASLADAVRPGGALVIYGDDEKTASIGKDSAELRAKERRGAEIRVLTFGIKNPATVRALEPKATIENGLPTGLSFNLDITGETRPVKLAGALGVGHIYSLLAAAAVGKARGLATDEIVRALEKYSAPKGRMNIVPGINGTAIIDDTYNSSPDAALTALETLKEIGGRKVVVLGDMMELGKYAGEEHRGIGKAATEIFGTDGLLLTVGQRSRATADGAVSVGIPYERVHSFDTAEEAGKALLQMIKPGDIILVKGSQSMRMERVSAMLLREPEKAGELLARQEKEWLDKK